MMNLHTVKVITRTKITVYNMTQVIVYAVKKMVKEFNSLQFFDRNNRKIYSCAKILSGVCEEQDDENSEVEVPE